MKAAIRASMARKLNVKCVSVPERFWAAVCVGWRIKIAWVERRMAEELRRGWKLKSDSGCRKIDAQTRIVRRTTPACAIGAVPGEKG